MSGPNPNPIASFFMSEEACAKDGAEHPWQCGQFLHTGNNSLIKYAGIVTCHAAERFDNNMDEMVRQANLATGFQDISNDYVTSVLTSSSDGSYAQAAQSARGAKRILDKKDATVKQCIDTVNNDDFRKGVMAAVSNGAIPELSSVSSDAQLKNELLGTCVVSGAAHTLCHYALDSIAADGPSDSPTPKPTPATTVPSATPWPSVLPGAPRWKCQDDKTCQVVYPKNSKEVKSSYDTQDKCKKHCPKK